MLGGEFLQPGERVVTGSVVNVDHFILGRVQTLVEQGRSALLNVGAGVVGGYDNADLEHQVPVQSDVKSSSRSF
jgi:hypothetical protein